MYNIHIHAKNNLQITATCNVVRGGGQNFADMSASHMYFFIGAFFKFLTHDYDQIGTRARIKLGRHDKRSFKKICLPQKWKQVYFFLKLLLKECPPPRKIKSYFLMLASLCQGKLYQSELSFGVPLIFNNQFVIFQDQIYDNLNMRGPQ